MVPVNMPQIGQDCPTGKIVQWLKQENELVQKGEVILTVESEKAVFEVKADQAGILLKVLYSEGDEVEIFKPLAYVGEAGETLDSAPANMATALVEARQQPAAEEKPTAARTNPPESLRQFASPAVRRLARERGIDLQAIQGSGPDGRITKQDVETASVIRTAPASKKAQEAEAPDGLDEDTVVPFSRMRQGIADRLSLSTQTIPHFYLITEVDMSRAQEQRAAANHRPGLHLTVTDLLIRAVALALRDYPRLNAFVERDQMTLKQQINIGVATAIGGDTSTSADRKAQAAAPARASDGLLVPVVPQADRKSVFEISTVSRDVSAAARRGVVDPNPASTFTISSLGKYGISHFFPIINPPECAILGIGAIERRVVVFQGGLEVREMMTLTLACDHRAVDGAYAAGFLNSVKDRLQKLNGILTDT